MNNIEKRSAATFSRWMALALAVQGIVASNASLANEYYVGPVGSDSNDGLSRGAAFATIAKSVRTMRQGDTTTILDGTYVEPSISFDYSGTSADPITLKADNPHLAILSSKSGCGPALGLRGSYIIIEGLEIQVDSSNIDCANPPSSDNGAIRAFGGLSPYVAPTLLAPNTPLSHCTIRNVRVLASDERDIGIKVNQDYCTVENSYIESSLQAYNSIGTVFRNNEIVGGDIWGASLFGKGGVRNLEIYNNVVRVQASANPTPQGIIIGGESSRNAVLDETAPFEAYNSVAYNNVVINESGGDIYAIGMMGAKDSAIFNNVVVGQGWLFLRDGYDPGGSLPVAETTDPSIKNNIFSCAGEDVRDIGTWWTYDGTLDLDYNNFYDCLSVPSQVNAITGDPLLIDPALNWHVDVTVPSPVIGAGTPVTMPAYGGGYIAVDSDKDGDPREDNWDLGVYETPGC